MEHVLDHVDKLRIGKHWVIGEAETGQLLMVYDGPGGAKLFAHNPHDDRDLPPVHDLRWTEPVAPKPTVAEFFGLKPKA